jgi:hypothetical protein
MADAPKPQLGFFDRTGGCLAGAFEKSPLERDALTWNRRSHFISLF